MTLNDLLFWRRNGSSKDPRTDPMSYGNIAIGLGYIDRQTLDKALRVQDKRLGEVLVEMEAITLEEQQAILKEQEIQKMAVEGSAKMATEFRTHRTSMRSLRATMRSSSVKHHQLVTILNDGITEEK